MSILNEVLEKLKEFFQRVCECNNKFLSSPLFNTLFSVVRAHFKLQTKTMRIFWLLSQSFKIIAKLIRSFILGRRMLEKKILKLSRPLHVGLIIHDFHKKKGKKKDKYRLNENCHKWKLLYPCPVPFSKKYYSKYNE